MNTTTSLIFMSLILVFSCIPTVRAQSESPGIPPAVITVNGLANYYLGVNFDHEMHMEAYDCAACHHISSEPGPGSISACLRCHTLQTGIQITGCNVCHRKHDQRSIAESPVAKGAPPGNFHIDTPGLKGAYHLQCLGCHSSEGGPVGCTECHPMSAAGKQLFLIKD